MFASAVQLQRFNVPEIYNLNIDKISSFLYYCKSMYLISKLQLFHASAFGINMHEIKQKFEVA